MAVLARTVLAGRRLLKTFLSGGVLTAVLLSAHLSAAAGGRVAVLGPDRNALVPRLQRNFASTPSLLATATVTTCSRDVVARMVLELDAESAICTDGDVVTVWRSDGTSLSLVDAAPILSSDDRSVELLAARATMAARTGRSPASAASFTIDTGTGAITPDPLGEPASPPVDKPVTPVPPPRPLPRIAPRAAIGAGPALLASDAGGALGLSVNADFAVSRGLALAPWFMTALVPREASGAVGTASYRPTLIGLGITAPLARHTSVLVPRLGVGYAILWVHVWPETAVAPAQKRTDSIDLLGAVMYVNAALSVKVTSHARITAEGMFGVSSHDLVVRLGNELGARWGVPVASLALRGEVVLP